MLKRIVIISLFLFFPLSSYASDNRLLDGFDKWEAEQNKKVTVIQPSNVEQNSVQPILYRNDDYKFRIKFPDGWEMKDGDGQHVVKKAVKDNSTILILVREFSDFLGDAGKDSLSPKDISDLNSAESNDLSDEEINVFLESIATGQLEAFPGSTVLEKGIRYIDNRKAVYVKTNQVYKVQNMQVEGVSINYFTLHKGKLYQIGGFYPTIPINETAKESIINTSLSTFVFENWDDTKNAVNEITSNSANEALGDSYGKNLNGLGLSLTIILSILFTWGLGLIIPLLLRFVFLKRHLSVEMALSVVAAVYFIQLIGSLALDSKSKSHSALLLVAFISYRIMRKGSIDKESSREIPHPKVESIKYTANKELSLWHSRLANVILVLVVPVGWIAFFVSDGGESRYIPILPLLIALSDLAVWILYKAILYVIYGYQKR